MDNTLQIFDEVKNIPLVDLLGALTAAKDLLSDPETRATFTPDEIKNLMTYMVCLQAAMYGYYDRLGVRLPDGCDGAGVWQPE